MVHVCTRLNKVSTHFRLRVRILQNSISNDPKLCSKCSTAYSQRAVKPHTRPGLAGTPSLLARGLETLTTGLPERCQRLESPLEGHCTPRGAECSRRDHCHCTFGRTWTVMPWRPRERGPETRDTDAVTSSSSDCEGLYEPRWSSCDCC